jgi:hypothetical protein
MGLRNYHLSKIVSISLIFDDTYVQFSFKNNSSSCISYKLLTRSEKEPWITYKGI